MSNRDTLEDLLASGNWTLEGYDEDGNPLLNMTPEYRAHCEKLVAMVQAKLEGRTRLPQ